MKVFLINGILLTIGSFLLRGIGMSFQIYISNKIGAEGIGVYQLILSVFLFSVTLASSGINLASTRIVSEELAKNDISGSQKAIKHCIIYSFLMGFIAFCILFFSADIIAKFSFHGKVSGFPLKLMAISLPFISTSSAINGYFTAKRKIVKVISFQFLEQILQIFVVIYLLNFLLSPGLESACLALVLGSILSEILSTCYSYFMYRLDIYKKKNLPCQKSFFRKIFGITIPVTSTSCIRSGLSTLKQLLVPTRLEKYGTSCETALAQYGVISGMAMPIILFPSALISSFSSLLIPELTNLSVNKRNVFMNKTISKVFKITILFSLGITGVFFTFSRQINEFLYPDTIISPYLKLISIIIVIMYLDTVIDNILKSLNKQVSVMLCNILDAFISLTIIFFLLPIYGVYGYIISIFVSEFLNFCISLWTLLRTCNTKNDKIKIDFIHTILKPILSLFLLYFFFTYFSFPIHSIFGLFGNILLFLVLYLGLLFFTSCLSKHELSL